MSGWGDDYAFGMSGKTGVVEPFMPGQAYEANEVDEQRAPTLNLPSSDSFASYPQEAVTAWPTLDPAALTGLAGRVVEVLSPHTEADPAALLLTFLAAFGNLAGPGPHAVADGADHPARLNVVLVGDTSRSRKGTAWANIRKLLEQADPDWYDECVVPGGLSTGEGLIAAVRDVDGDDEGEAPDKRRLVMEPEFARVLAVAAREGNTLSAVLRSAWDDGRLRVLTRKDPLQATGAHISIVGHITTEELARRLADTEVANGFANRLLFTCVRRSKLLPHGGRLDPAALDHLAEHVGHYARRAQTIGLVRRSQAADVLWHRAYHQFGDGPGGLAGALVARPEAQTLRLSVVYALLDGSAVIEREHLEAALAVWRYCEASALFIFGDSLGDPIADRLLAAIRDAGQDGLDTTAQHQVFGRNVPAARLAHARAKLERRGLVVTTSERTGGRDRRVTRARTNEARLGDRGA
jgi:hypothetical protein